jgi:hypothetical protein
MGVGRFAFTPIFPVMQADEALSVSEGAWLAAANYLGYLVGAIGALGVSGRASTLIRAALVATAATTVAMGVTHAFSAWLVWRGIAGAASAFLLVFISAMCVRRLTAERRPMLNAAVFSGVGAGIFSVGILVLGLHHFHVGSSRIWLVLGVLSFFLTALIWRIFASDGALAEESAAIKRTGAQPQRRAWPLVVCYGLLGFGYIIPATFLPIMAKSAVGGSWTFGLSWPAFGLAAFVSTFVGARLTRHASAIHVWRTSQVLMALGVALPAMAAGLAPIIAAAICVGGTFMVITMFAMQTATQFGSANPRPLMAGMTASFAAGQLAGPLTVSGLATSGADLSGLLLAAAVSLVAGALLLPRSGTTKLRASPDSV